MSSKSVRKSLTAILILAIIATAAFCGCNKKDTAPAGNDATAVPTATPEPRDISNDTSMAPSILYADKMANSVQGAFDSEARNNFKVTNTNSSFNIDLAGSKKGLNEFTNSKGVKYFTAACEALLEKQDGTVLTVSGSGTKGRINLQKLGYFFYEVSLRDLEWSGSAKCGFEQILNVFGDKVYNKLRLISDEKTSDYKSFGYRYTFPVSSVSGIQYETDSGKGTDIASFDGTTCKYIALDITDAGIFGIIIPADTPSCVTLVQEGDNYILTNYVEISGNLKKGGSLIFGHRIFVSDGHDFSEIEKEAYIERNPLELTVEKLDNGTSSKFKSYDGLTGVYTVSVTGSDFNEAYKKGNSLKNYGGIITAQGDGYDRNIYILTTTTAGCLEGAAVLDENSILVPIAPQVCKNFAGEKEEPYYDPQDTGWGNTYYPVVVKANSTLKHTVLNLYQMWGQNKLKQVSSISYVMPYYHISTGVTETNCIAPYFIFGRDGWTLPDFRGLSGKMWSDQPQYNSVGKLKWLSIDDYSEYTSTEILSSGNVYADVVTNYKIGNMVYSLRHTELPSGDENRTFYELDVEFTDDMTIEDVRDNFTLFDFDGRYCQFKTVSFKNEDGNIQSVEVDLSAPSDPVLYKLSKGSSFLTLYNGKDDGSHSTYFYNFGLAIADSYATVGGQEFDGNFAFRLSVKGGSRILNFAELTMDLGTTEFKKGDKIHLSLILTPYGTPNQTNFDNFSNVLEDSIEHPFRVSAITTGTETKSPVPHLGEVDCDGNKAEFTVTGGRDVNVIKVNNVTKLARPIVEELVDGNWVRYEYNYSEYDGYEVLYNKEGTYSYAVAIFMEDYNTSRTFRFTF